MRGYASTGRQTISAAMRALQRGQFEVRARQVIVTHPEGGERYVSGSRVLSVTGAMTTPHNRCPRL